MKEKPLHEKVVIIASLLMALIYIGGGIYLISSSLSFSLLPVGSMPRYAFAGILILYGFYRGYRVLRK